MKLLVLSAILVLVFIGATPTPTPAPDAVNQQNIKLDPSLFYLVLLLIFVGVGIVTRGFVWFAVAAACMIAMAITIQTPEFLAITVLGVIALIVTGLARSN